MLLAYRHRWGLQRPAYQRGLDHRAQPGQLFGPGIEGTSIPGNAEQGVGIAMIAKQATVRQGLIGVVLSPNVTLEPGTRVLINTPQAIIIGTIAGVIISLFRLVLPRARR